MTKNTIPYQIHVRDLLIQVRLGVFGHEIDRPQRVLVNFTLDVMRPKILPADALEHVVDYDVIVQGIRALQNRPHIHLIEIFAENILDLCLKDSRVTAATVRLEKMDIYTDAHSGGITVTRRRASAADA